MENKSKESKWQMKAVKEKLQIFFVLKRPSEMENVPQKITLRDKLTLGSQTLAQTLVVDNIDSSKTICAPYSSSNILSHLSNRQLF